MKKHKKRKSSSVTKKVSRKSIKSGRSASDKDKSSKVRKMKRWFATHKKKRR